MKRLFTINQDKIEHLVSRAYQAMQNPKEAQRLRQFMPQWNLPEELEHNPKEQETRYPEYAAKYLFTEAWFERRTQSREIIAACRDIWGSDDKWIFEPRIVAKQVTVGQIERVMERLPYRAHSKKVSKAAEEYKKNAGILFEKFDSDPRNMIQYHTTEEARRNIDSFWGIGRGIANLYILYCLEREIASPIDPENALLKIDIHKGRIPFNLGAVKTDKQEIRISKIECALEKAYWKACEKLSLPPEIIDGAIWVIGSELCSKKDYSICQLNCPLAQDCIAFTPSDKRTTTFQVYDSSHKRIDTRKNLGPRFLFNWQAWQNPSPQS